MDLFISQIAEYSVLSIVGTVCKIMYVNGNMEIIIPCRVALNFLHFLRQKHKYMTICNWF